MKRAFWIKFLKYLQKYNLRESERKETEKKDTMIYYKKYVRKSRQIYIHF